MRAGLRYRRPQPPSRAESHFSNNGAGRRSGKLTLTFSTPFCMNVPTESPKSPLPVVISVVVVLLLCAATLFIDARRSAQKNLERETTIRRVNEFANQLDARVERGRYQRFSSTNTSPADAWGQLIHFEYREEGIGERIIVCSAGSDCVFGTKDDVTANRFLMNAKGIGEEIRDGTASVTKEAAKGAFQGVKEELKNSFRRKTSANEVR